MTTLKLSDTHPDYSDLLMQLQSYAQLKDAWDVLTASNTGQTLMEQIAAVGALNAFSADLSLREAFLQTAMRDSSIYAGASDLGVRIARKTPAGVNCLLIRQDVSNSLLLPSYTAFNINGKQFFNRNYISFEQGQQNPTETLFTSTVVSYTEKTAKISGLPSAILTVEEEYFLASTNGPVTTYYNVKYNFELNQFEITDESVFTSLENTSISILRKSVRLYEGTIKVDTFTSTGLSFQEYYLSEGSFTVSDIDVNVYTIDTATNAKVFWTLQRDGLWMAGEKATVFYDRTSGEGQAVIMFGNEFHGDIPVMGNEINVRFAVTSGQSGNVGLSKLPVLCMTNSDIKGTTLTTVSGGADERSAKFYKKIAPQIFKANNRAEFMLAAGAR